MNLTELIALVAERSGESKATTGRVLRALGDVGAEALERGDTVSLSRLGRLAAKWRGRTSIRDIRDGRKRMLGGRWVPAFRPSGELKRRLLERTEQHWRDPEHQKAWRLAETLVGDLELYAASKPTLAREMSRSEAREACRATLGPDWRRAEETFSTEVPPAVRDVHDYLLESALERWC